MTELPPRKRFQIHLSTAIVMMFVAGGMIWANVRAKLITISSENPFHEKEFLYSYNIQGWPFIARKTFVHFNLAFGNPNFDQTIVWSYWMVVLNSLAAFMILALTCFLCEWLIRRRAARKDA